MKKNYNKCIKDQKGSPKTSRKQIAAGFKKINWEKGTFNFDIGGGKYNKATNYLAEKGVINLIYDPYNRSKKYNRESWEAGNKAKTSTLFNVLNVIPSASKRNQTIKQAKRENTQTIYITVYEKDKSGVGSKTRDGYQNNMTLKDYLPEIQKVYGSAYINKNMIIIDI